ncbi:MAG: DUF1206 domain-containing protein [Solirubrobacteraceae bacterium]|nr:DUF1206 domain-containing protein [Solirubrobacteraceae bacterium]
MSPSTTSSPSAGAQNAARDVQDGARQAKESESFRWLVRLGLIAYGVVHLLIGWLAIQLALGDSQGSADNGGALHTLAETPVGRPLLWLLVVGFGALVIWQLAEAAIGHEDRDGAKRTAERILSAAKAVIYGALAFTSAKIASGGSSGGGSSTEETWTARLMEAPAGQGLVGLVGLGILALGAGLAYYGWSEKFTKHLNGSGRGVVRAGKVGYLAKGVAFGVLGALFVVAAVEHDAQKGGGLDDALKTMLGQPYGPILVGVVGLGIASYGVYCFARARDLRTA